RASLFLSLTIPRHPRCTLFPYTTLFRSRLTVKKPDGQITVISIVRDLVVLEEAYAKSAIVKNAQNQEQYGYIYLPSFYHDFQRTDRKSTRLNSSHVKISYAVFCLKKKIT